MAGETNLTVADGMFKDVYGGISDVRPTSAVLQRRFKFKDDEKVGDEYKEEICLQLPSNRTYTGTTATPSALNTFATGNNGVYLQAAAKSYETITRDRVMYKVLNQATAKGPAAFEKASSTVVNAINTSASLALEISLLRGQYGLGVVESNADSGGNVATIVITADSFSAGLWYSLIGAYIDSMTGTTVNNAGLIRVTGVTPSTRTVTVAYTGTWAAPECSAADVLYPKGSHSATPTDFAGLIAQAANLTGTSLGLSATTYANWAGNTYDAAGPISFRTLEEALHIPRSRASEVAAEGFIVLAGRAYGTLSAELLESGRHETGKSSIKNGVKSISYQTHELGSDLEIVYHPFMSDGHLLILPASAVKRPGCCDVSFEVPGMPGKYLQSIVTDTNAYEIQAVVDQTVMLLKPSCAVHVTGITY